MKKQEHNSTQKSNTSNQKPNDSADCPRESVSHSASEDAARRQPISVDPEGSILRKDLDLQNHLKALSLATLDEYVEWCRQRGFSTAINKNWKRRCKERYSISQEAIKHRCKQRKREKRRPHEAISHAVNCIPKQADVGSVRSLNVESPWAQRIQKVAAVADESTRGALQEILRQLQHTRSPLLQSVAGHSLSLGDIQRLPVLTYPDLEQPQGSYLHALASIARYRSRWIRPIETWRPNSKNTSKQFSSLCRHLLAKYPTPRFLDCVWFCDDPVAASAGHEWFLRLANGTSVRKLGLPIPLTKKMAAHFLNTPSGFPILSALRRAQLLACGGRESLLTGLLTTRLATTIDHNEFWLSVIRWMAEHCILHPLCFAPLVDYFHYEKFDCAEARTGFDWIQSLRPLALEHLAKYECVARWLTTIGGSARSAMECSPGY